MQSKLVTRAYNRFEQDTTRGTLIKFSKDEKLRREAEYYINLPEDLKIFFPRLVSSGFDLNTQEFFLELEQYPYGNLGAVLFGNSDGLVRKRSELIACHLKKTFELFLEKKPTFTCFDDLKKMYVDKTEREQKNLVDNFQFFNAFSKHKLVTINGIEYENFHIIWPKIIKKYYGLLATKPLYSVIHGDCCFSNILFGGYINGPFHDNPDDNLVILKFIDPRGEFGQHRVHGDFYYDLAKLYHSTNTGYELIIGDQFDEVKSVASDNIDFSFPEYLIDTKNQVHAAFMKEIYNGFDLTKIKLLEATIYIGMCARHYDSLKRQKIMYASGIKLLNEVYYGV